jgi:hypothetical protein
MSVAPGPAPQAVFNQPGSQPVTIGGIEFWTQEAPAKFQIGGVKQNVIETELVGGSKVTHQLGAFAKPFTFRGKFLADRVASQIPAIRALCTNGTAVALTYGPEQWTVVVKDVQPTYNNQWWAEYDIEVVVVTSTNGALGGGQGSGGGPDQQVNGQQQQAQNLNQQLINSDPPGVTDPSSFQSQLSQLFADLQSAGPLVNLTSAQRQNLLNDVTNAVNGVQAYLALQVPSSLQYAIAGQLSDVLTLIGKNITIAQATKTLTQQGGTLYRIAAKYYPNVDPGVSVSAIMAASGLCTATLSNQQATTLVLPTLAQAA